MKHISFIKERFSPFLIEIRISVDCIEWFSKSEIAADTPYKTQCKM